MRIRTFFTSLIISAVVSLNFALGAQAQNNEYKKLWKVSHLEIYLLESNPPIPVLEVKGLALTAGWENARVSFVDEDASVVHLEFKANPPSGPVSEVITEIGAARILSKKWHGKTLRVSASENSQDIEFDYDWPPLSGAVGFLADTSDPKSVTAATLYDVKAIAMRHGDKIGVTISGALPDSCATAQIVDKYPGGNIHYIRDPGHAQVFIKTTSTADWPCLFMLVPWTEQIVIEDESHDTVEVYVDGKLRQTVEVKTDAEKFIVIAPVDQSNLTGCQVIPADSLFVATHAKVYGPASLQESRRWVAENCGWDALLEDGYGPIPLRH